MKHPARSGRRAALALLGLAVTACSSGVVTPGVPPQLKHSWEVAFNRGDVEAVAALYAEDAQLVLSGAATIRGRAAIGAELRRIVQSGIKVRITSEQNAGSGDLAYVYGPYAMLDPTGAVVERGSYVEVWRRRGGAWRIDLDVNAAGAPLTAAAAAQ